MNSLLMLQHEIQRYGNFLPLHSVYCAENTIKKAKIKYQVHWFPAKEIHRPGTATISDVQIAALLPIFRLSWFPISRGL